MSDSVVVRTSRAAFAGFVLGILALTCAFLAFAWDQPELVFVAVVFVVLTFIFGCVGRARVRASDGRLRGSARAMWGMLATIPAVLFVLLMPAT